MVKIATRVHVSGQDSPFRNYVGSSTAHAPQK